MKKGLLFLALAAAAQERPMAAEAGVVKGSISIDGEATVAGFKLDESVVSLSAGGAAIPGVSPVSPEPRVIVLDQRNKAYSPHVLAVRAGTTVEIRNSDPEAHNVHASCKKNLPFNVSMPRGMKPQTKVFAKPELVTLTCNIHRDMRAYVHVLETPYFAMADSRGSFEIRGVPDGSYTATFWHEKFDEVRKEIRVTGGSAAELRFDLSRSRAIRRK